MNRYPLNGAILGNGGNDSRSFAAATTDAVASATAVGQVLRMAAASVQALGSAASLSSARYQAASQETALATAQADGFVPSIKESGAAVAAGATSNVVASAHFRVAADVDAVAGAACVAIKVAGIFAASSVRAVANHSVGVQTLFPISGSGYARASGTGRAARAVFASAGAFAYARAGNFYATEFGAWSLDRLMVLPSQLRHMEIPA